MRVIADHGFEPNSEIDGLAWVSVGEARDRLTYDHDRTVLDAFATFAGHPPA
jgi:8-oxo-dGTP diphosphatase